MVTHFSPPLYTAQPRGYSRSVADVPSHRRAAPSISSQSRASTSRRHRRSTPQNEFPIFAHTGDVEILVRSRDGRQERRYLLHRLILSQNAGFFEAGMGPEWTDSRPPPAHARRPSHARGPSLSSIGEEDASTTPADSHKWRYELDWGEPGDDTPPMLVKKDRTNSFSRESSARRPSTSVPLPTEPPLTDPMRDHDNLFRIFYNYPPALDGVNIANAYVECKSLLTLADMYDALPIVGPRVDHHLLRFQSRLWKQIAKYPPSYLKLGYLARSRAIFSEALIHVVGQWPLGRPQLRTIPPALLDLIEDKADDLADLAARIESRLWRLSPSTSRGDRVTPSSAWLDWLALSLWRQWFAETTSPPPPSILKPSARSNPNIPPFNTPTPAALARAYTLIHASGPAYLNHDAAKRFLKLRPDLYSRDALRRFERRLDDVKALARDVARPLARCELELDLSAFGNAGLGYLTCVRVAEEDFVWEDEGRGPAAGAGVDAGAE